MSFPVCPACQSSLDPTHAPVARVRNARVVTYCSSACADAAEAGDVSPPVLLLDDADLELDTDTELPRRGRRGGRRLVLALASAIMVGGMAMAIIQAVSPTAPGPAQASRATPPPPEPPPPVVEKEEEPDAEDEPALPPERLREAAIEALRGYLDSTSPRLRRLAAVALSRTGDDAALRLLRKLLGSEDSALLRVEIAFALARAGVSEGREHLVGALESQRRDVRLDAARSLVELGDDSGRRMLSQMTSIRTHRLGAAGLLARLGDAAGTKILEDELRSRSGSEESRMRAAVALGRAGDESVRERLRSILDDRRYNVGAADALAILGDEAAIPALTRQLGLTAMRVPAASALRRLEHAEVDLAPLAVALTRGDDAGKVSAAEAVLILTGDDAAER